VEDDLSEIIVTGTHIRGASFASPVTEIGQEEIARSGYTSIAELLLTLPQNFGGGLNPVSAVNNNRVNAQYGDNPAAASVPNLRGLGPGSTLTLIDGHRMASGLAGGGADISSIPLDAVERVEVVTDSASAIYGSDAVAGVINVILKKNYEGAKTDLSYSYAPEGGGAEKAASQLVGTRWSNGSAMLAFEHRQQDAVDANERDFTRGTEEPYSLLPSTKSNSVTLSARQEWGSVASLFVDGLYVAREANRYITDLDSSPYTIEYPTSLRKFAVTAGADFNLPRDWKATIALTEAEDKTTSETFYYSTPMTPGLAERLSGTLRFLEVNANGTVIQLPAGPLRLALGAAVRRESFANGLGDTLETIENLAAGKRSIRSAFAEASVPLLNHLDLMLSARTEDYSDAGSNTSPKIGLAYSPLTGLKFRGTWGKAFRAPNLNDLYGVQDLVALNLPDPASATGASPALLRDGGNPGLRPETATAWSLGVDFSSSDNRLKASSSLFEVKYHNRITKIGNPFAAFTDPNDRFFVTPSPSADFAQAVIDSYPPNAVFNLTGAALDPATVKAVVEYRLVNLAQQTARGIDANLNYRIDIAPASTLFFLNAAYLDLMQQNSPAAASETLSGLAFYPPKFRTQAGLTLNWSTWALTGLVNYMGRESDTQVIPSEAVGSWTTVDTSLRYTPPLKGFWGGINLNLSVLNVLNKDPPHVSSIVPGVTYDSSNANPIGRLITLQVSKQW
jgi:iron complex outermembrane recepter protein